MSKPDGEVEDQQIKEVSGDAANDQATSAGTVDEASGTSVMEKLQQYMSRAFHLGSKEKEDAPQVLEEVSFAGVANYIKSGKCKNIITMVGAGISTAAGIPDFRSPNTGLYDNLQRFNLPNNQAIFMIDYFMENPKPFFVLAKELYPGSFKPTISHYFIRMLHENGVLLRHYTQNIDTLERVAGLPPDKLVEAHGSFQTSHCLRCRAEYSLPWMKEKIFADEIPTCTQKDCKGVVKPDIVFFGEGLPDRFARCVSQDMKKCDLLIVMGTSLVVQPFASLIHQVPASTPRLYINLEKSPAQDDFMALLMGGRTSFRFDEEDNIRDVFEQATCDDGCSKLANLLGWGDELNSLVKTEHEGIDKEMSSQGTEQKETSQSATAKSSSSVPSKDSGHLKKTKNHPKKKS